MDKKLDGDYFNLQINKLEIYVKAHKVEDASILSYLFDVKELRPVLVAPAIYRKMEKMYRNSNDVNKVSTYYQKSINVFIECRNALNIDKAPILRDLIDTLNNIIIDNYEKAYEFFLFEFNI